MSSKRKMLLQDVQQDMMQYVPSEATTYVTPEEIPTQPYQLQYLNFLEEDKMRTEVIDKSKMRLIYQERMTMSIHLPNHSPRLHPTTNVPAYMCRVRLKRDCDQ
ncbi:hypothetical protein KIN20_032764 [Parelaphostrongylus tenuis]|uniref:Uncharacterized protein n=1 Tax=Parelaphostrongylus tenuis TaxID=148309 RepID=A0AAD5R7F5_PARTN|nr:hypothetical protein KIN20_032764 [Parelaphostrongylus tenuis]